MALYSVFWLQLFHRSPWRARYYLLYRRLSNRHPFPPARESIRSRIMAVEIVPIEEKHIEGFRLCLDGVAREKKFLVFTEAPSLQSVRELAGYLPPVHPPAV